MPITRNAAWRRRAGKLERRRPFLVGHAFHDLHQIIQATTFFIEGVGANPRRYADT